MRNDVVVHRVVKNTKQSGQYIELHSHTFFHYIYSLGGHTRTIVGDEAYQTGQGTLLLIPPGVPHEIISLDISSCLDLKFSCSGPLTEEISRLPRYIPLVDSEINSLIHNIFEEAVGQERDYEEVINISLYRVLIQLLRKQEEKKSWQMPITYPVSIPDDENICHILQIIEGAMGKPIQVADLAAQCGYSASYFRQFFRERVGISPNLYVNQRKISKAKELMLYSDLNVTQISEYLGYQSIHYFSRLFKKMTGTSPKEYIQRVKENRPINVVRNEDTPAGEFEIPLQDVPPDKVRGT